MPPSTAVRARGTTTVSERAVERIVARALDEADDDSGAVTRTVLGVPLRGRRTARTHVHVDAEIVTVRMAISVTYPRPVREVARRVREAVRGRVEDLTGLSVRQVDIEVAELDRPDGRTLE